jgi:Zn-dependent protease with chaperone function
VTFALLGAAVALAVFAALATLGTAVAALPARLLLRRARPRAGSLLLMRTAPALFAAAVTVGAVMPAYLAFEPRKAEVPGGPLIALAGLGAALFAVGAWRVCRALLATRALRALWRGAEAVRLPDCPQPALVSAHPFPIVAAVGVLRPRLLVARQVLDALSPAELAAAARHEMAHVAARDNLQALLLRGLPDVFGVLPVGRRLEAAWREAVEESADAAVGPPGTAPALDLAAALVKVARLAPARATLPLPTPALHDGGPLARRVRTLAGGDGPTLHGRPLVLLGAALLLAPALALASPPVLHAVHRAVEVLVHTLR